MNIKNKEITTDFFEIEKIQKLENHSDKFLLFFLKLFLKSNKKINKKDYIVIKGGLSPYVWCSSLYKVSVEEAKEFLDYLLKNDYIEIDDIGISVKRVCFDKVRDRNCKEYVEWRKEVFIRDGFTCQNCGKLGGKLNAHHIKSFSEYPSLRFDIDNGITLCEECHKNLHKKRGRK